MQKIVELVLITIILKIGGTKLVSEKHSHTILKLLHKECVESLEGEEWQLSRADPVVLLEEEEEEGDKNASVNL